MCQFTSLLTEHFDFMYVRAFLMYVENPDDHITVGSWAACGWNQNFSYTAAHLCFTYFAF